MFCLALRAEAFEEIGPLDEAFGVGTLEDDDYSMRARRAGRRPLCAEAVLVHHFGEGSFGKLFGDGGYSRLLERNRRRFEGKWGQAWEGYGRRESPQDTELVQHVRRAVPEALPPGSTVLVVSKGDERLLDLEGGRGPAARRGGTRLALPAHRRGGLDRTSPGRQLRGARRPGRAARAGGGLHRLPRPDALVARLLPGARRPAPGRRGAARGGARGLRRRPAGRAAVSPDPDYRDRVDRIRALVRGTVPDEGQLLVISRGDDALLRLDGRRSGHFPPTSTRLSSGHY